MIWDSNYSMWIEDDSVKTITAGTTTGTDVPVLRRAYCSPKNNYINDLIQPEAIPIEWMRKFANERALNDGMDCYWHFWGEDLFQMIEHWRKENEQNDN